MQLIGTGQLHDHAGNGAWTPHLVLDIVDAAFRLNHKKWRFAAVRYLFSRFSQFGEFVTYDHLLFHRRHQHCSNSRLT